MPASEFKERFTPDEPEIIRFHRLHFEFAGHIDYEELELEPIFAEEEALIQQPSPGAVVKGVLVDCPETKGGVGTVVVDTEGISVAICSVALRQLVIENAPCTLEFVAVPLRNHAGDQWWDWEAYEISPTGARTLVSEAHCELRMASADEWASEIRDRILPNFELEQRRLNLLTNHLTRSLGSADATLQNPSVEDALSVVKEQFFGPIYRRARRTLEIGMANGSDIVLNSDSHYVHVNSIELTIAREIIDRYAQLATRPVIHSELQSRLIQRVQRVSQLQESLRRERAGQTRVATLVDAADRLLNQLAEKGSRPICLCQSTLAASRHLAVPSIREEQAAPKATH